MGAVGAEAPTVFESMGVSNFSHISNHFHKNGVENVSNLLPSKKYYQVPTV